MNLLHTIIFTATAADPQVDVAGLIVTSVVSATVVSALIGGIIQYFINRRNSRVTERKNAVDAESDLVVRYKEAASEERAQKESAVETVKNLLGIAEAQVDSLKSTIITLNTSIDLMTKMANAQQEVIDHLTFDRDRTKIALERAVDQIEAQKAELLRHQKQILELTYSEGDIDAIRKKLEERDGTAK
jgi:chromosome segregation ATPase